MFFATLHFSRSLPLLVMHWLLAVLYSDSLNSYILKSYNPNSDSILAKDHLKILRPPAYNSVWGIGRFVGKIWHFTKFELWWSLVTSLLTSAKKKTEVRSTGIVAGYRMPLTAFFIFLDFRDEVGVKSPPPPPPRRVLPGGAPRRGLSITFILMQYLPLTCNNILGECELFVARLTDPRIHTVKTFLSAFDLTLT